MGINSVYLQQMKIDADKPEGFQSPHTNTIRDRFPQKQHACPRLVKIVAETKGYMLTSIVEKTRQI